MGDAELGAAVSRDVVTIDDVLAVMQAIGVAVGDDDGIGWFNRLYQLTTKNIQAALEGGRFAAPDFTTRLDVVFARYYFRAVALYLAGSPDTPRAWAPLFERRASRDVAPIQFALAGMNAHIDRDLSFAVVEVAAAAGRFPGADDAARRDFQTVNDVLAETEREAKAWFEGAFLRRAEFAAGRVEDVVALFSIAQAREAAWLRAEAQWAVRDVPAARSALAITIDRAAAAVTRALLLPTRLS
jgi:Family of unknown function (DUF5995)